jgi:NADH-quinone oxidoreductase subunit D
MSELDDQIETIAEGIDEEDLIEDLADLERNVKFQNERLFDQTNEGAQGYKKKEVVITGGPWPQDVTDETMIVNMGPQHPSTHGVLRLMVELDGEIVVDAKPIVGYLHTGMEKTGEELTYVQGCTNVTRMDYASPLSNELVFSLAAENLLGIEIPERATWARMLLVELNRISSHLFSNQWYGCRQSR